jgi:murein DD-endopeptidase MepM/ murein hydrolase activator NlpD
MMARVGMLLRLGVAVFIALTMVTIALREQPAQAAGHPIYTLPFFQESHVTCSWGPYYLCGLTGQHNGTDYSVGSNTSGGEDVVAAMDGTAYHHTEFDPVFGLGCGYYVVIAHGNGHRSRYCHLSVIIIAHGNVISRGQWLGARDRQARLP